MDTVQLAAFGLEYAANYTFLIWYEVSVSTRRAVAGMADFLRSTKTTTKCWSLALERASRPTVSGSTALSLQTNSRQSSQSTIHPGR